MVWQRPLIDSFSYFFIVSKPRASQAMLHRRSKQVENFSNTVCKAHGASAYSNDLYYHLKFNNGDMKGRGTHHDICDNTNSLLLAWIPYHLVEQFYAQELDPKESYINYIGKGTDREQNKSELCHFRHSDLVNHISSNLFTCVVMIFEDNFYDLGDNINVLIEIQPLSYELRNVTYSSWINATAGYKTLLGKTTLKNYSRDRKYIYGSLNYTYQEQLEVNLSSIYSTDMLELPLFFEHKNIMLELDDVGTGGIDVNEKVFFGRKTEPRSNIDVNVIGQWSENHQKFKADVYEYYGSGIRRFKKELNDGDITFTRIENAEPVFDIPTENDLVESNPYSIKGKPMERIIAEEDTFKKENISLIEGDDDDDDEKLHPWLLDEDVETNDLEDSDDDFYSDLYPWIILGVLVVAVVSLAIIIGIVHVCSKKEPREKYKFNPLKSRKYILN
uniref:Uncharacterized protein n=1 Tax=Glossina brevipalpis TaxID=37001 RepID=A0A1A9WIG2_9MUSC